MKWLKENWIYFALAAVMLLGLWLMNANPELHTGTH